MNIGQMGTAIRNLALAAVAIVALDLQGASAQVAGQDAVQKLVEAYNESGQQLYKSLAAKPGNIVFSPYSIGTAMAMVLSGARGQTEREMMAALHQNLPRADIDAANAALLRILNAYDTSAQPPTCPPGMNLNGNRCEEKPLQGTRGAYCQFPMQLEGNICVSAPTFAPSGKLLTANALMLTPDPSGDLVAKDYAALVKDKYAAEIFQNASLDSVNGWVKTKTAGKISKILAQLDPSAGAVILDAVYFKARWQSIFEQKFTQTAAFHLSGGGEVQVPTMQKTAEFSVATRPGYRAIRLPYQVPALGMIIVLPAAGGGVDALGARLDAKELSDLFLALGSNGSRKQVALSLPRFKADFGDELGAAFRQDGMNIAFTDAADFSGITGRPPNDRGLKIGAIMHRAVIEATEESTEAAAASAVEMPAGAVQNPETPESFQVDRPFLFYVVDSATGVILFQGRIVNPGGSQTASVNPGAGPLAETAPASPKPPSQGPGGANAPATAASPNAPAGAASPSGGQAAAANPGARAGAPGNMSPGPGATAATSAPQTGGPTGPGATGPGATGPGATGPATTTPQMGNGTGPSTAGAPQTSPATGPGQPGNAIPNNPSGPGSQIGGLGQPPAPQANNQPAQQPTNAPSGDNGGSIAGLGQPPPPQPTPQGTDSPAANNNGAISGLGQQPPSDPSATPPPDQTPDTPSPSESAGAPAAGEAPPVYSSPPVYSPPAPPYQAPAGNSPPSQGQMANWPPAANPSPSQGQMANWPPANTPPKSGPSATAPPAKPAPVPPAQPGPSMQQTGTPPPKLDPFPNKLPTDTPQPQFLNKLPSTVATAPPPTAKSPTSQTDSGTCNTVGGVTTCTDVLGNTCTDRTGSICIPTGPKITSNSTAPAANKSPSPSSEPTALADASAKAKAKADAEAKAQADAKAKAAPPPPPLPPSRGQQEAALERAPPPPPLSAAHQPASPKPPGPVTAPSPPPLQSPGAQHVAAAEQPKAPALSTIPAPTSSGQGQAACVVRNMKVPWGGSVSASITVLGEKSCLIGWRDTENTLLDGVDIRSSPAHGTLSQHDQHSVAYRPSPGFIGQDSFGLSLQQRNSDTGETVTGVVDVTVTIE